MKESINRKTEYPINPLMAERWSPRSMTGESLPDAELLPLSKRQDGPPLLSITNLGYFCTQREIPKNGNYFSIF